jgi:hypothetical protein
MREGLLLVRSAHIPPLVAACESLAVLGVQEINDADELGAWSLALGPLPFLRPRYRIPMLWSGGVVVLELVGDHVPALLNALAQSAAAALELPAVRSSRIILPN